MEYLQNAPLVWFIIGFVLLILEFVVPGLILLFFGAGAWVVALICFFMPLGINTQLILFLASSILSILMFRKSLKKIMWSRQSSSEIEDEFLGKTGIAETYIGPGSDGKVDFKGTMWDARSADVIGKGEKVTITGNESILLIVQSTKTII